MAERKPNSSLSGSAGNRPEAPLPPGGTAGPLKASWNPRRRTNAIAVAVVLFVAVVWTFLPSLRNGFLDFDDDVYVCQNTHVQSGLTWQSVSWAFTNWEAGFWHPLTWLSIMVDSQVYGLRAWGHHLTSLLLHAASTVLLFLALRRMTGATWRSALVAALFGLHPLHVESVAWASERKDVLSGFFWMLTMLLYVRYVQESKVQSPATLRSSPSAVELPRTGATEDGKSKVAYGLALVFFVCGLMSKPMVVTLPLVLLLLDWWPLQRFSLSTINHQPSTLRRLLWEKVPFLAASLGFGAVTLYTVSGVGALAATNQYPLAGRVQNALLSYLWYLQETLWPTDLAVFYPYPEAVAVWRWAGAGLLGLLITGLVVWGAPKRPYLAAGWIWYVVTLLPVIGLVQVSDFARADRFTYVPLIGVFLLLTWGACDCARGWRYGEFSLLVAAGGVVVLCGVLTRRQIGHWRDEESLWRHALAVTENNDFAHHNLGVALARKGAFGEAIEHLEEEVRLSPARKAARHSLAYALLRNHRFAEAILQYEEALRLNPGDAQVHNDLGNALVQGGRVEEAIQHYEQAVRLSPGKEAARSTLAYALVRQRRFAEAIQQYKEALRLNPGDAQMHNDLANTFTEVGRLKEAIRHYTEALQLTPGVPEAHYNLGLALASRGNHREAAAQFREVFRLSPSHPSARQKLDQALAAQQKLEEASEPYRQALRSNPRDARAHGNLGRVLLEAGQLEEAVEQCAEAARLDPKSAEIQYQLGAALARKGEAEKAARQFELVLELEPGFAAAHYALGIICQRQGRMAEALKRWREAARLAPQWPDPLNNLAWALATDPRSEIRDGGEAVKVATRAVELAGTNNVGVLDTLAAAYAEAGRFAEAIASARQAQAAAAAQGQAELVEQIQQRLALYSSNRPYRLDLGGK